MFSLFLFIDVVGEAEALRLGIQTRGYSAKLGFEPGQLGSDHCPVWEVRQDPVPVAAPGKRTLPLLATVSKVPGKALIGPVQLCPYFAANLWNLVDVVF